MTAEHNDDATNQRFRLLVGLVVVSGAVALTWALNRVVADPTSGGVFPLVLVALCAVAQASAFRIRIRASNHDFAVLSSAVLISSVIVPVEWVVVCATSGALIMELGRRAEPVKASFNAAKECLSATAVGVITLAFGVSPVPPGHAQPSFGLRALVMFLAAIAYAVIDEGVGFPVIALATHTPSIRLFRENWDIRVLSRFGCYLLALGTSVVVSAGSALLVAMPPLLYALHLAAANGVRRREEREAWQRLARTTDEFSSVDLDTVLRRGVIRAAELFSCDEVEITLEPLGPAPARVVRGDSTALSYDGPAEQAPSVRGAYIGSALEGHDNSSDIGELRLRFREPVRLSEREQYTLRTFAAALTTAVRNAAAYAEAKRMAAEQALKANLDSLTGLANRRRLLEHGQEILATAEPCSIALVLIDLNHFKEINDTLGHTAGDRVLSEVALRLARSAGPHDLVVRLGGDEFAVLLVGLSAPSAAVPRARSVVSALNRPIELDGMRLSVEASGGVATASDGDDIEELLRRADVAMYQAKREGNRVALYESERDTADLDLLSLAGDLVRAVANNEFIVNFQPIVDLASGKVIAAEALARWSHPDLGYLSPGRFLESVERSGQLPAFAEAVLDQALTAVKDWSEAGFPLPVAVNVSPRSLLDTSFPVMVLSRLARHGLSPDVLVLELTESRTLSKLEVVDEVLGTLRNAGLRLALDDFGTGYSSLATIARVPVHELKIDRSFVERMDSPAEIAVIRSTIELGRSLNLAVVAEGVEREEQRRALWELGCPFGQGHLFARSMPSQALISALRAGFGDLPGTLAAPLHDEGSVIRIPPRRPRPGEQRQDRSG